MSECSVVRKSWGELTTTELYSLMVLRTNVFYVEQKVDDEELDWRDTENTTEHYWIADETGTISYLRVLVDSDASHLDARHVIGRVVVRADRRGQGLAQALLARVVVDHGTNAMVLHAQEYAAPLYAKFGFVQFGEVYEEAGLPHLSMYRAGDAASADASSV